MLTTPTQGVDGASQQTAEYIIAGYLGGTSLESRVITQDGYLDGQLLTLRDGPATALGTVAFNGMPLIYNPVYPGPRLTPWAIDFTPLYSRYSLGLGSLGFGWQGYPYSLTYTAGWTANTLPEAVSTAIHLTAAGIMAKQTTPAGLVKERLGDVENQYTTKGIDPYGLPSAAVSLLAPYRALRF